MEAVHVERLLTSLKAILNIISQNGGLCIHMEWMDDNHSTIILKIVLFMEKPKEAHLQAFKQILRYLKKTIDFSLHLSSWEEEAGLSHVRVHQMACRLPLYPTVNFGI